MRLRDQYNAFIARHEVAWELTMAALAVAFVVVGLIDEEQPAAHIQALEALLTAVFLLEFASRLVAAYDRKAYIRAHWIDLVALIPAVRGGRLLRLVRLLRLIRAFAGIYRALSSIERFARHRTLLWLFTAWLAVAGISSAALYLAEHGENPAIESPADALWWGVVTLTTVGYGDVYPVTPEGRLAGAGLMVLGITLFAAITGTITSLLVAGASGATDIPTRMRTLAALHRDGLINDDEYTAKRGELIRLL